MIFEKIKEHLQNTDITKFRQDIGYARDQNIQSALYHLSIADSLDEFLEKGHFDWCHHSKSLIIAVANYFNLDISKELDEAYKINEEKKLYYGSHIRVKISIEKYIQYIYTEMLNIKDFDKRYHNTNELKQKHISLAPIIHKMYFKDMQTKLSIVSEFIKTYHQTIKSIPIQGNIVGYQLYLIDKIYNFDINGNLKNI